MKRYRIADRKRFTVFAVLLILVCIFAVTSFLGLNDASGAGVQQYVQVKVEAGDTLWALAGEYGPSDMDIRRVVYEICRLNDITADSLCAGQYITVPTAL